MQQKIRARKITPSSLGITPSDGHFALTWHRKRILTPNGAKVSHSSREFLQHVIEEFDKRCSLKISSQKIGEPKFFGPYAIYDLQKQFTDTETEGLSLTFGASRSRKTSEKHDNG